MCVGLQAMRVHDCEKKFMNATLQPESFALSSAPYIFWKFSKEATVSSPSNFSKPASMFQLMFWRLAM